MSDGRMTVEVWSDIMCPFCYLGKRRFEKGLAQSGMTGEVDVVWRSFQLMPHVRTDPSISTHDFLAREKGIPVQQAARLNAQVTEAGRAEGLSYDFDRVVVANTLRAHRLVHLAREHGREGEVVDALFRAHFAEGRNVDDPEVLVAIAGEAVVPEEAVRTMLAGDAHLDAVAADIDEARQLGITGVPFFVFDRRDAVSGAQSPETFAQALAEAARR